MNIRESLNKLDHKAFDNETKFYDLVTLYESVSLNENEKKELCELCEKEDSEVIYDYLYKKLNGEDEDELQFVDTRKNSIVRGDDDPGFDEYDLKESEEDYRKNDELRFVDTRKNSIVRGDDDYGFDEYDLKESKLNEAAPSKLGKRKDTSRTVTNTYWGMGEPGTGTYTQEDKYGGYSMEGYIMDKQGNKYPAYASQSTGDAGRIVGGSQNYYVTVDYNGTPLKWSGYSAVFSRGSNEHIIGDVLNGIYLEDFCARYPYSDTGRDIVKQLAEQGDKDAISYSEIKAQRKQDRFEKRYIPIERYDLYLNVTSNGVEYNKEKNEKLPEQVFADSSLPDRIKSSIEKNLCTNGYTLNDFSNSVIKVVYPSGAEVLYDTKYHMFVFDDADIGEKKSKWVEVPLSYTSAENWERHSWQDHSTYKTFDEPIYGAFNVAEFDIRKTTIFELVKDAVKTLRKSSRKDWIETAADRFFKDEQPYWGYKRGEVGTARKRASGRASNMFDAATDALLEGDIPTKVLIECINMLPKKEVVAVANTDTVADTTTSDVDTSSKKSYPSSYYEKMKAWNEGTRKQNVRACSDDKLLAYYNICKEMGYAEQADELRKEIDARHLPVNESLSEARSYGGAFDISDDQLFTREDLDDFGYRIVDELNAQSNSKFDYAGCWVDGSILSMKVEFDDGYEAEAEVRIDYRKLNRKNLDPATALYDYYASDMIQKLIKEAKESGADIGWKDESLTEDSHERWYVTTYLEDQSSGPEEGGWVAYGKRGDTSRSFTTKEEAEQYFNDTVNRYEESDDYDVLDTYDASQGGKVAVIVNMYSDSEFMIALENSHTRGSHENRAKSWAEMELGGYEPERAYFDKKGERTSSPTLRRKQKERQKDLDFIYRNALKEIEMADTIDEIEDLIYLRRDELTDIDKLPQDKMKDIFKAAHEKMNEIRNKGVDDPKERLLNTLGNTDLKYLFLKYKVGSRKELAKLITDEEFEDLKSMNESINEDYWMNQERIDKIHELEDELKADGYQYSRYINSGSADYDIYKKFDQKLGKGVWKAIKYREYSVEPQIVDITYDQALGREPLDSFHAMRMGLGKMLLPHRESLKEDVEERPQDFAQVKSTLKELTNNWTNRNGSVQTGFEEEKRFAIEVLKQYYKYVEPSYDDRGTNRPYVIAYSSPIKKNSDESLKEDLSTRVSVEQLYNMCDDSRKGKERLKQILDIPGGVGAFEELIEDMYPNGIALNSLFDLIQNDWDLVVDELDLNESVNESLKEGVFSSSSYVPKYGNDYSNLPEVTKLNYRQPILPNRLPGIDDMNSFINALEETGYSSFKIRSTHMPVSNAAIKDEWMKLRRRGWHISKDWDNSMSGFAEVYVCSKNNRLNEETKNFGAGRKYNQLLDEIDRDAKRVINRGDNESPASVLKDLGYEYDEDLDPDYPYHIFWKEIQEKEADGHTNVYNLVFDFTKYDETWGEEPVKYYVLMNDELPKGYTYTKTRIDEGILKKIGSGLKTAGKFINKHYGRLHKAVKAGIDAFNPKNLETRDSDFHPSKDEVRKLYKDNAEDAKLKTQVDYWNKHANKDDDISSGEELVTFMRKQGKSDNEIINELTKANKNFTKQSWEEWKKEFVKNLKDTGEEDKKDSNQSQEQKEDKK